MGAGADPRMNFKRLSSQTHVCVCVDVCVWMCVCVCGTSLTGAEQSGASVKSFLVGRVVVAPVLVVYAQEPEF
jgi:hypothetical protein